MIAIPRKTALAANFSTLPKFIAVGIAGVLLGTALLWFLTEVAHVFYLVSASISAAVAITSDFILNSAWTFSRRRGIPNPPGSLIKRLGKYAASKSAGFVISFSVLALLTQVGGMHYLISNIFAIGASFAWNYTLSRYWVWSATR